MRIRRKIDEKGEGESVRSQCIHLWWTFSTSSDRVMRDAGNVCQWVEEKSK